MKKLKGWFINQDQVSYIGGGGGGGGGMIICFKKTSVHDHCCINFIQIDQILSMLWHFAPYGTLGSEVGRILSGPKKIGG